MEKLNTTLSVEKRSDHDIALVLMSTHDYRPALQAQRLGRLYGLSLPVIVFSQYESSEQLNSE